MTAVAVAALALLQLVNFAASSTLTPIYAYPPNRQNAAARHSNITSQANELFQRLYASENNTSARNWPELDFENRNNSSNSSYSTDINSHSHSVHFNISRAHRPRSFIPHPGFDLNTVNHFLEFVPLDYENGEEHERSNRKRAAVGGPRRPARARAPHHRSIKYETERTRRPQHRISRRKLVTPVRRNHTITPFKRIISKFHEKVARLLLGPPRPSNRRRWNDQRYASKNQQRSVTSHNDTLSTPRTTKSITSALQTVATLIKQNNYVPVLSKSERVRKLSIAESKQLDRRRGFRRRRRKYPRKYHRPRGYDDEEHDHEHEHVDEHYKPGPPPNFKFRGLNYSPLNNIEDEEEDDDADYVMVKKRPYKPFRPWKFRFGRPRRPPHHHRPPPPRYHDDDEDHEHYERKQPRKKPWFAPDKSSSEEFPTKRPKSHHPHPDDFFKPHSKYKSDHYKIKKYRNGDQTEKLPKIVINHHHNLPPAAHVGFMPGGGFMSPQYSEEYYSGRGRANREYMKSAEHANSFVVNDYFKEGAAFQSQNQASQVPVMNAQPQLPDFPNNNDFAFNQFGQQQQMLNQMFSPQQQQQLFNSQQVNNQMFSPQQQLHPMNPFPNQLLNYPLDIQPQIIDPFANHQQFNPEMFSGVSSTESGPPPPPPPHGSLPDASPFPSTLSDDDSKRDEELPDPPLSTASREQFFKFNHPRNNQDRKSFQFTLTKSLSHEVEIPAELPRFSSERLILPGGEQFPPVPPKPIENIFDLGVPDRGHYEKKHKKGKKGKKAHKHKQKSQSWTNHGFNPSSNSREDTKDTRAAGHSKNPDPFGYSTLPDNWNEFRPDPSHSKLPKLTYDDEKPRIYKLKTALTPKGIMKAIMSRFPRAKKGANNRAHTKFTHFDAKSVEDETENQSGRKKNKTPHSIQDIIDSDSSNKNGLVLMDGEEPQDPFSRRSEVTGASEENRDVQTEMPEEGSKVEEQQQQQSFSIPVRTEMQMMGVGVGGMELGK